MKRTIKEWQKDVDELNIRGERLLWELRVVLLQCPSEYREKFAFSAPKSHIFSRAGGLTNNGSSGLPSGMSGVGKVENHSQNPCPSKPDESRGWITKNGRHIFIGDSGTSGGGGVDKSGESGIMNVERNVMQGGAVLNKDNNGEINSPLILSMQFFGTPNFSKQRTAGIKKSIASLEKQIEDHKMKITFPEKSYPEWNTFSDREKAGYRKHWQREIENFSKQIEQAKEELNKRGE